MAKTIGEQSGSVTCNDNQVTNIYTAPSTGVTKIIMCDWTLERSDGANMNTGNRPAVMYIRKATPSSTDANGNVVIWAPAPGNIASKYRYAVFGAKKDSIGAGGGTFDTQLQNHGGTPQFYNTTTSWSGASQITSTYDVTYSNWATSEFYMVSGSQMNLWHRTGSNSTTLHYSFITINET